MRKNLFWGLYFQNNWHFKCKIENNIENWQCLKRNTHVRIFQKCLSDKSQTFFWWNRNLAILSFRFKWTIATQWEKHNMLDENKRQQLNNIFSLTHNYTSLPQSKRICRSEMNKMIDYVTMTRKRVKNNVLFKIRCLDKFAVDISLLH